MKWFFALNHFNYAQLLTVHVFDLTYLPITCQHVYEEMMMGFFTFAKSKKPFSRIASDQVHGQKNKIIKGLVGSTNLLNTKMTRL